MRIQSVHALEILDSRGNPTVQATVCLEDGSQGTASVPSGASTGEGEAIELRDHDESRFKGLGVLTAVKHVNEPIAECIRGMDAADQLSIDNRLIALDQTPNKSKLGANAILSVSLAVADAEAKAEKKPLYAYLSKFNPDFTGTYSLPIPLLNVVNGGKHANWSTDIQEFMIIPHGAHSFAHAMEMGVTVYMNLKAILKEKGYVLTVGDEGGFAPAVSDNEEPYTLLLEAISKSGYTAGTDISLGIDAAASEFYEDGKYVLKKQNATFSAEQLIDWYTTLFSHYPIVSMEDPFDQKDWSSYTTLMSTFSESKQIVGDDLYVTNTALIQKGIELKATNTILIKLNQIGTLSETVQAILLGRRNGMKSIVSHRSGETEDTFIADFVVAMGCGQIKTGAPARSERTCKYNRLLAIERELGSHGSYTVWK